MHHLAPIALFVYNRPDHTRRTLSFLLKNLLADESRLFVFSDGAKNEADQERVNETREIVRNIEGFKSVKVIEREKNLGLAESIVQGVTELTNEYGKVIVFEDDLISSPYTLTYFNTALQKYKNDKKAMHISAYMYPLSDSTNLPETFFYRAAHSWGWATWKRAWDEFEPNIDKLIDQFDRNKVDEFTIEGKMNFWKQIQEFKAGKNNSWAIRWYASIFLKGGLALNPSQSLINNIGHDGTGVHSNVENMYNVTINQKNIREFPSQVSENKQAYELIRSFLKQRKGNLLQRAIRFIKQKL